MREAGGEEINPEIEAREAEAGLNSPIFTRFSGPENVRQGLIDIGKEIDQRVMEFEQLLEKNQVGGAGLKALAFNEALSNAVYHGNLGVNGYQGMQQDWFERANDVLTQRLGQGEEIDGQVTVKVEDMPGSITILIKDQGRGFDWKNVADPTSEENLREQKGRGIFLIYNAFGRENVNFNERGNEITLVARK